MYSTSSSAAVTSELVSNAIVHGAAPVELTLRYEHGEVTVEVADGDSGIDNVKLRALGRRGTGAYGLRIVASLADRWGTRSLPSGKTVWATIRQDARA